MSIYWPYEVSVGSDVLAFSFELPEALVAVFTENDRIPSDPVNDVELASIKQVLQAIMRIDW